MSLSVKLAAVGLLAVAMTAVSSRTTSARTYEHARALGVRCSTCHESKRPHLANLNAAGRYFLQHRSLDGYKAPAAPRGQAAQQKPAPQKPAGQKPAPGAKPAPGQKPAPGKAAAAPPGLAVYDRACAVCHGPQGRGTPIAAALNIPRKHATTEAAAIEVIRNGIKGTAMAPFRTALTEQEIRDVARYVMTLKPRGAK